MANPRRRDEATDVQERELLAGIAAGDQTALGALFDALGARVYGVIHRVLRDPAQAEEVTQEVMLEVWANAARFDGERGSPRTWIVTMARRRAIDRVRSEQASRDRTRRMGIRDQGRAFDEVSERVILDEEHAEVTAALGALTDLQRRAIELAYFEGHTYREVAELLDTPLGTVKTRMRDGLLRMRDVMEVER
ncbi:MAG: ECF RNA polymerase sigma factor SigK [Nitriliruptoraceae bacterium]